MFAPKSMAAAARSRRTASLGNERVREALVGYAFILVPMGVFGLFFLYPMAYSFYVSVYEWGGLLGKVDYIGLENYRDLWNDRQFWIWPPQIHSGTALWNTFYYAALVVPLQIALGLTMAVVVNQGIRARGFFRSA